METALLGRINLHTKIQKESIGVLAHRYLYYMENIRDFSPETIKSRRCYLKEFTEYFCKRDIEKITNSMIDQYFVYLKNRTSTQTGELLSYGSLNNRKRAVRVFLKWCMDDEDLNLKIKISKIYIKRDKDRHTQQLEKEYIELVISKITDRQDRLMVQLMYEAGLRISELADVRIEHLRGARLEVVGKGDKRRITFISGELALELHQWMADKSRTGYVFKPTQRGGEKYSIDPIRQRIKKWFRQVADIRMHPHQLRHAYARNLLDGGCSIRAIQKLLGHAHIETTMTYLGVDDNWLEKEYMRAVHHNNTDY